MSTKSALVVGLPNYSCRISMWNGLVLASPASRHGLSIQMHPTFSAGDFPPPLLFIGLASVTIYEGLSR